MSPQPPGTRLLRMLSHVVDEPTMHELVAPTIADLQFEVGGARGAWQRLLAYIRLFVALARVAVGGRVPGRMTMRRVLTVVLLGGLGGALWFLAMRSDSGNVRMLPLAYFCVLVPIVIRLMQVAEGFPQMVTLCASTSILALVGLAYTLAALPNGRWPAPPNLALIALAIALGGALVSALIAPARRGRADLFRHAMRAVLLGSIVYAAAHTVAMVSVTWGYASVISHVMRGSVSGFLFALPAALLQVPLLLLVRRRLRGRWSLAMVGALFFPLPLLASNGVNVDRVLSFTPALFALVTAPHVLACGAIGWLLARPGPADLRRAQVTRALSRGEAGPDVNQETEGGGRGDAPAPSSQGSPDRPRFSLAPLRSSR